jgi:hypothetical protein
LNRTIRSANLGELHITLAPTAVWTPSENDHAADVKARDEIARLGGIDRRGRLDIDLEATLSLLCKPRAEFYGWLNYDHATIAVLVAASGRDAVLAIRTGDTVSLTQAQPEHLPELLIAQAPDVPPARGHTITVTLADLKPDTSQVSVGVGARHGKPEVRMAQQIMETPTTGGGQLFTAVRDSMGRRHRVTHPLRYIDTVHGRWINVTLPGQERRVFLAPADRRAVVGRLHDMHVGLTGR